MTRIAPYYEDLGPLAETDDWRSLLAAEPAGINDLRTHTRTGRPFGSKAYVARVEKLTGRILRRRKPGPKPRR